MLNILWNGRLFFRIYFLFLHKVSAWLLLSIPWAVFQIDGRTPPFSELQVSDVDLQASQSKLEVRVLISIGLRRRENFSKLIKWRGQKNNFVNHCQKEKKAGKSPAILLSKIDASLDLFMQVQSLLKAVLRSTLNSQIIFFSTARCFCKTLEDIQNWSYFLYFCGLCSLQSEARVPYEMKAEGSSIRPPFQYHSASPKVQGRWTNE